MWSKYTWVMLVVLSVAEAAATNSTATDVTNAPLDTTKNQKTSDATTTPSTSDATTTPSTSDATTNSKFLPDLEIPGVPKEHVPVLLVVAGLTIVVMVGVCVYCMCCRSRAEPVVPVYAAPPVILAQAPDGSFSAMPSQQISTVSEYGYGQSSVVYGQPSVSYGAASVASVPSYATFGSW